MKISEVIDALDLEPITGPYEREVKGGYVSDLLSDVLANGNEGNIWVTIQVHRNVVAVAALKDFAGVVMVKGRRPDAETIAEAEREKLNILGTQMSTYEVAGKLYALGIR